MKIDFIAKIFLIWYLFVYVSTEILSFLSLLILSLTFIQGLFSAPSTTDSMIYHLPKVMHWIQDKTVYQDVTRNTHDFKAPFAEESKPT